MDDLENLFASIHVDYWLYALQNLHQKRVKPFCKKPTFKKLLHKRTNECVFLGGNSRVIEQIDGCPFRSWVICKNLKRPVFDTLVFYTFINNSRSKKNKKNPTPAFVDITK